MKKILFIVDVENWAYDDRAKKWKQMLSDSFDIDILYLSRHPTIPIGHGVIRLLKEYQSLQLSGLSISAKDLIGAGGKALFGESSPIFDHSDYDGVLFFYHRALCDSRMLSTPIPLDKVGISINNEKWVDSSAQAEYNDYMRGAKVISACNSNILDEFSKYSENVLRLSQCVDNSIFYKTRLGLRRQALKKKKRFRVGWSGSPNNPLKNLNMLKQACKIAGVEISVASDLKRVDLNHWYNRMDAIVCASKSEGGPMMLLEAGAVGVPVISTRVGLAREIIEDDFTGMLVDWNAKSIANAISNISSNYGKSRFLAKNLNNEILNNWTYSARSNEIRKVLSRLVG